MGRQFTIDTFIHQDHYKRWFELYTSWISFHHTLDLVWPIFWWQDNSTLVEELKKKNIIITFYTNIEYHQKSISHDLYISEYILIRNNGFKKHLCHSYTVLHKVISRVDKYFTVIKNGKHKPIAIDRIKPAYVDKQFWQQQQTEKH